MGNKKMKVDLVYKILEEIFCKEIPSEPPGKSEKLIQMIIHGQIILQHVHLYWYPSLSIDNFDYYKSFWTVISYPCLDSLFAKLDAYIGFLLISISSCGIVFCGFLSCFLFQWYKKKIPFILCRSLKVIIFLICHQYYLPVTISLCLLTKYSNSSLTTIEEYENNLPSSPIDYGLFGKIFGSVLLVFHLLFSLIYDYCSFNMDHGVALNDITSRITGSFDALFKLGTFINCILYITILRSNYISYLLIVLALHTIVLFKYVYYLPCYSEFMNFMKILVQGLLICIVLFFILGWLLNNASIIIVFSIILTPFMTILVRFLITFRLSKLPDPGALVSEKFLIFELSVRKNIIAGEMTEELVKFINKNYKTNKDKLNLVVQANYCREKMDKSMLGLMKISRTNHHGLNLPVNYQVYKCKETLQILNSKISDGLRLYKYLLEFRATKKGDLELCEDFLRLLDRILEKNTQLSLLKNIISETCINIKYINQQYTDLLKMVPDSIVVLDMYASLLVDIIGEQDRGKVLYNKKSGLGGKEYQTKKTYSMKIEETSCLLIVSGSISNMGKVIYANSNLLKFLTITEEAIRDCYLWQFIPKPFEKGHDEHMVNFIEKSNTHCIFRSTPLFLSNQNGYLVECYFNSECIGYEGEINFLSVIEPIKGRNREAAIISLYGEIYSHTEKLPEMLGAIEKSIEGRFLQEFLENMNFKELPVNCLWVTTVYNATTSKRLEIGLFIKEKIIGNTKIIAIYASCDREEIIKWKSRGVRLAGDMDERKHQSLIKAENDTTTEVNLNKTEKRDDNIKDRKFSDIEAEEIADDEGKKNPTSSSNTKKQTSLETKSLMSSLRALSIMKYLLLASVTTIIIYNIIILIYISNAISHANSLETLNDLGDLAYVTAQIALISRTIDTSIKSGTVPLYTLADLHDRVNSIKILQEILLKTYNEWSFCDYSKIVRQDEIPYWDYLNLPDIEHESLHSIIGLLIESANDFIAHIESNSTDYKSSLYFIIYNGIGISFRETRKAMVGLTECEHNRVIELNNVRTLLLIVAMVVSGFLASFLAVYILYSDRIINTLWESLQKKVHAGYYDFRQILLERLSQLHDQQNDYDEIDANLYKQYKPQKFYHSMRFIKRFIIFFIIAGVLYIVTSYVFYEHIHNYLYYRPTLMYAIISRRISLTELCFFSNEIEYQYTPFSLDKSFYEYNALADMKKSYKTALADLLKTKNTMRDPHVMSLMSKGLEEMIFQNIDQVPTFLSFGTYAAMAYLNFESQYISYDNKKDDAEFIQNYIEQMNTMTSQLKIVSNYCNSDSKHLINEQLDYLKYFIICFSIFIIMIYAFYYYPYLAKEQKVLKRLTQLIAVLPMKPSFVQCSDKESTRMNK
ncbi:hypothetical protein SteCoe_18508 [Stentor coeruleus]|uniref:PAS domain-containing protein n=1 Tax=Stentor coeruleus TaxID=5963 RepID=A0A1R2BWI5_9CILI|nr:hypothetical protein SteCoe_18508 [Stentor coeruleus]